MFRALGRLLRKHRVACICATRVDEALMLINQHAYFEKARHTLVVSIIRSIKASTNKCCVESNPISWHDVNHCLGDLNHALSNFVGATK